MKISLLAVSLGLVLGGSLPLATAQAQAVTEEEVTFEVDGQTVVGTLTLPSEGGDPPPIILLLHGFTGTRDELEIPSVEEGVFARAARIWAEQGVASLRIDFRGSGESDGAWEETTLTGQIDDAMAAIEFLADEPRVDGDRLALVGWSQGGLVATAAATAGAEPDAVALWAPVSQPAATYAHLLGAETIAEGLASEGGPVTATLPWGAETTLRTPFYESIYAVDPVAEIAQYAGPLFVAVGTLDDVVMPQPYAGQILLSYHEGPEELWVRPMDHVFNAFTDETTVDELIDATLTFLAPHLHLEPGA